MRAIVALVSAALASCAVPSKACAQGTIEDNDFTIDQLDGPVLSSARTVGLGGAYVALGSSIDAAPWNPAAYAMRETWESDWFEWEVDGSILLSPTFANNDFYNSGNTGGFQFDEFVFLTLGGRLLFGATGVGAFLRTRVFTIEDSEGKRFDVSFSTLNTGFGHVFHHGDIVVGSGVRLATLGVTDNVAADELVSFFGLGMEFGGVYRPNGKDWRVGLSARTPTLISTEPAGSGVTRENGVTRSGPFVLPGRINLPWELQVGGAYKFGGPPLNRNWWPGKKRTTPTDVSPALAEPSEQEYRDRLPKLTERSRRYVLVSGELYLAGSTDNGVGVEGFLLQRRIRSGRHTTVGVRLGVETEVIEGWVRVRAGSYLEPSRFENDFRVHGTSGFDVRMFTWDLFGLTEPFKVRSGAVLDVAERYFNWGISLGLWH